MATKTISAVKKAPTLNDSRFHTNNVVASIKALDKWIKNGIITDDDKHLIEEYIIRRRADRDLSQGRVSKITWTLLTWRRFVPQFRENTITDIYKGINTLKTGNNNPGGGSHKHSDLTPYSKNFIYDAVTIIKPFYIWLLETGQVNWKKEDLINDKNDTHRYTKLELRNIAIERIRSIKRPKRDLMTKTVADILTEKEIKEMVENCESTRDRAILMLLYDGGFRIGELGKLTWGQVSFDKYGAVVNVDEKTGKPRYVRLLAGSPYLAKWKDDYPFDPIGSNLVFVSHQKKAIAYDSVYRQIRRIAERASIKKKVHPHIFRHTRITNLIEKGIPESVIKNMMWGSLTTDMFACYAHLSNRSTDDALLEQAGIKRTEKTEKADVLTPIQCQSCHTINAPTSRFCSQCGRSLTEEAQDIMEVLREAKDNPDVLIDYANWRKKQLAEQK